MAMADEDKVAKMIAGHAMRFIRNDGDPRETDCLVEMTDRSEDEIELAFTLDRDRYYLRMRADDLRRLLKATP
jgi:hypothetical protein